MADTDQTLTDFLLVRICRVKGEGCEPAYEFTSQPQDNGLDYLKLQNDSYHVNWKVAKRDARKTFELHFIVAGLEISSVTYTPRNGKSRPIIFAVDNHPRIRARVLHQQGYSATEIAQVLIQEFGLEEEDVLAILVDDGFSAYDLFLVLVEVYSMGVIDAERVLYGLGYSPEEYLEFTALEWVSRFAPALEFDGSYRGLPMSADLYFNTILDPTPNYPSNGKITWTTLWNGPCGRPGVVSLCARDECTCGMENNDFARLLAGDVPTDFKGDLGHWGRRPGPPAHRLLVVLWFPETV